VSHKPPFSGVVDATRGVLGAGYRLPVLLDYLLGDEGERRRDQGGTMMTSSRCPSTGIQSG
jgi:hypothetical protein